MDKVMDLHKFAESLEHAVEASSDPHYGDWEQRVFGNYALALLDLYAIDDKKAVLVK